MAKAGPKSKSSSVGLAATATPPAASGDTIPAPAGQAMAAGAEKPAPAVAAHAESSPKDEIPAAPVDAPRDHEKPAKPEVTDTGDNSKTAATSYAISPELRAELAEHCTHYANARVGLIWVMQQLQKRVYGGWLPDEGIYAAAEITGVAAAEVEGVATFFNWFFRNPVGREIITVCDSLPCHIGGCDAVNAGLKAKLGVDFGGTTADGAFTLLPIVCLGNCDQAPSMMIGEDLYDRVDPTTLDGILAKHRQAPEAIAQ